jgi:hypothetical protein
LRDVLLNILAGDDRPSRCSDPARRIGMFIATV